MSREMKKRREGEKQTTEIEKESPTREDQPKTNRMRGKERGKNKTEQHDIYKLTPILVFLVEGKDRSREIYRRQPEKR